MSAEILRPISGFADAACWAVQDDTVVYVPQNRSYKEVLKGGTPIEYLVGDEIPTIVGASPSSINVRFTWPRVAPKPELPTFDFIESETFMIGGKDYCYLDHDALLELPWMQKLIEDPMLSVGFNESGHGHRVDMITRDGAIWLRGLASPIYITQNLKKAAELRCVRLGWTEDGWLNSNVIDSIDTIQNIQLYDSYDVMQHHYTFSKKNKSYEVTYFWDEEDDYRDYYEDRYDRYERRRRSYW